MYVILIVKLILSSDDNTHLHNLYLIQLVRTNCFKPCVQISFYPRPFALQLIKLTVQLLNSKLTVNIYDKMEVL